MRIEKAAGIGPCFGVRRAIGILEKVAHEHSSLETLGAVVHNQQVLEKLSKLGIRIASSVDDIQGDFVAISAHGLGPQVEKEIRARHINIIDTTCPFVHRAQITAQKLAKSGFFVIIYGDSNHPEVKGVLDWADGKGIATLDEKSIARLDHLSHRLGVISQTTQIPSHFSEFVKRLIDSTLIRDSELHIIDTICHDARSRQAAALKLASRVDLMLVIGSHTSANTNRLSELCSTATKTYLVEATDEIQSSWLEGLRWVGVTAGASTALETIDEVMAKLEAMALYPRKVRGS